MPESRGAAGDLAAPIAGLSAIDHHAHVLAAPGAGLRLADVLTESRDQRQIEQLWWHPAYRRALRVVSGERSPERVRRSLVGDHTRCASRCGPHAGGPGARRGHLVDDDYLGAGAAVEWAELVLAGNARRLYG